MYDETEFNNLMTELTETKQLAKPKTNMAFMLGYFTVDGDQAIRNHINNMVETFGKEKVLEIIRQKIENGEFYDDKTDKPA